MWVLGDSFGVNLIGKLEQLKRDHVNDPRRNYFFLQDSYDVITQLTLTPPGDINRQTSSSENFAQNVRNYLVHLTKVRSRLPSDIIIVIGCQLLTDIHFVKNGFKLLLNWLADEIQFIIKHLVANIPPKCKPQMEPKVWFVKAIPTLINETEPNQQKTARRKFNRILEHEMKTYDAVCFNFITINDFTSDSNDLFHSNGKLNDLGETTFWLGIANHFKRQQAEIGTVAFLSKESQTEEFLLNDYIQIEAEKLAYNKNIHYKSPSHNNNSNWGKNRRRTFHAPDRYHWSNNQTQ